MPPEDMGTAQKLRLSRCFHNFEQGQVVQSAQDWQAEHATVLSFVAFTIFGAIGFGPAFAAARSLLIFIPGISNWKSPDMSRRQRPNSTGTWKKRDTSLFCAPRQTMRRSGSECLAGIFNYAPLPN
jgi:hypothetical protein